MHRAAWLSSKTTWAVAVGDKALVQAFIRLQVCEPDTEQDIVNGNHGPHKANHNRSKPRLTAR
jgi:hypothetical protein